MGTVQALLAKPDGGRQWLLSLRGVPYKEASEALCQLPGIGPKASFTHATPYHCLSFRTCFRGSAGGVEVTRDSAVGLAA